MNRQYICNLHNKIMKNLNNDNAYQIFECCDCTRIFIRNEEIFECSTIIDNMNFIAIKACYNSKLFFKNNRFKHKTFFSFMAPKINGNIVEVKEYIERVKRLIVLS